jgi:hypothetical protein
MTTRGGHFCLEAIGTTGEFTGSYACRFTGGDRKDGLEGGVGADRLFFPATRGDKGHALFGAGPTGQPR